MIYCIQSGEAVFHYPDENIHVREGDILFRDSTKAFWSEGVKGPFRNIGIQFRLANGHPALPFRNQYRFSNTAYYKNQFTRIYQEYSKKAFGYQLRMKAILYPLLNDLVQQTIQAEYRGKEFYKIIEAVKWIENGFSDKNLTVEQLAERCLMHETYFRRLFHRVYQTSPKKYIMEFRMKQAADLLKFTDLPVSNIADAVGYSDIYYFSAAFKRTFGLPPTQYRREFAQGGI